MEEWEKEKLFKNNKGYEPQDIYNADESGLFFKLATKTILSFKWEYLQWQKELQVQNNGSVCLQSSETDKTHTISYCQQ